jgi:hypothetical protein
VHEEVLTVVFTKLQSRKDWWTVGNEEEAPTGFILVATNIEYECHFQSLHLVVQPYREYADLTLDAALNKSMTPSVESTETESTL